MSDELDFDLTGALPFDHDADAQTPQKQGSATLGGEFAYIGKALSVSEFADYVRPYNFGSIPPDYIILHHTAIPSTLAARYPSGAVWDANEAGLSADQVKTKRVRQLDRVRNYYRDTLGWSAGPHLWIDERFVYLFTPMYDVGIHAKQGNSYRDSSRRLHYSIGIEVVGYYEKVVWPTAVAQNVAQAVAILAKRLRTFGYVDKPWAGGISAHRHYGKPACPGAKITPSYYMPILRKAWDQLQGGP